MPLQSYLGGDRGGSDLPRFDRPALKQVKSYSSATARPQSTPSLSDNTRSAGMGFFKGRGSREELPLSQSSASPSSGNNNSSSTPNMNQSSKPRKMRAAVTGREGVLPDWSRSTPSPANSFENTPRPRNNSESYATSKGQHNSMSMSSPDAHHHYLDDSDDDGYNVLSPLHPSQQSSASAVNASSSRALRQRKPMDEYPSPSHAINILGGGRPPRQPGQPGRNHSSSSGEAEQSPYRPPRSRSAHLRWTNKLRICCNPRAWTVGHFFQTTVVLLVTFLLYDSHHKSNLIAQRLKDFKSEEAMVFLHLDRIEQQMLHLHESLQNLDMDGEDKAGTTGDHGGDTKKKRHQNNKSKNNNSPHIDAALIEKQTQQLMQMEEELSHEVRTLQTRIQHSAVRSIVHEYGEGPVQVILEVVVDGQTSKISILLWHDTPHAAWTWLEQISHRWWDGATIHLENNRIMNVVSAQTETEASHLDFVERSQQRHEAWTVGLTDSSAAAGTGKGVAGLEIFINLQDNTEYSKHDVCVGKVFDGFDVLHKIVEQTRELEQVGGQHITIKTARASHLTNRETKGLI